MLQLVPKQKKKRIKKSSDSAYTAHFVIELSSLLCRYPRCFFKTFLSSLSFLFCFLFLFNLVDSYTGVLLWLLKIKLGVAAQLTRLQALGPSTKNITITFYQGTSTRALFDIIFSSPSTISNLRLRFRFISSNSAIDIKCGRLESVFLPSFPCTGTLSVHKGSSSFCSVTFRLHL